MKIGIITQPLHSNYGGILQNYALQQVLNRLGHRPVTLEGRSLSYWLYLYMWLRTFIFKNERKYRKFLSPPYKHRNVPRMTWRFVYKYINLSRQEYSPTEECILKENLDAIIVGSDQVWRPKYNKGSLYESFLEHCQNLTIKKIAYAASFGTSDWEYTKEQEDRCARLIQQFDAISVREESGVQLCAEHLKRNDAVWVLDPTLLLNKKDYEYLCRKIKSSKNYRKTLLAYILDPTEDLVSNLKNLAEVENMELNLVYAEDGMTRSVEEWLAQFRDADAVITNSYHGTIFSIIFQKPFYTIINAGRGADRFNSLLSSLNISDRLVDYPPLMITDINWASISLRLNQLSELSFKFLKNALN